jgi:dUTP pyrophosphatase
MNKLRITTGNGWYKKSIGQVFPVLDFNRTDGYLVDIDGEEGLMFYVKPSDCEVVEESNLPISGKKVKFDDTQELLIKLIPNSEGKCVDFPVKLEQGDWIDLRACVNAEKYIKYQTSVPFTVSLGISCKLPEGYEAIIAPRSSLFKKQGLTLVNSIGIIDSSYCGNDDIWMAVFMPHRDGLLSFNERICQFRIQKNQPTLKLTQVDNLEGINRGGFGEGTKNEK